MKANTVVGLFTFFLICCAKGGIEVKSRESEMTRVFAVAQNDVKEYFFAVAQNDVKKSDFCIAVLGASTALLGASTAQGLMKLGQELNELGQYHRQRQRLLELEEEEEQRRRGLLEMERQLLAQKRPPLEQLLEAVKRLGQPHRPGMEIGMEMGMEMGRRYKILKAKIQERPGLQAEVRQLKERRRLQAEAQRLKERRRLRLQRLRLRLRLQEEEEEEEEKKIFKLGDGDDDDDDDGDDDDNEEMWSMHKKTSFGQENGGIQVLIQSQASYMSEDSGHDDKKLTVELLDGEKKQPIEVNVCGDDYDMISFKTPLFEHIVCVLTHQDDDDDNEPAVGDLLCKMAKIVYTLGEAHTPTLATAAADTPAHTQAAHTQAAHRNGSKRIMIGLSMLTAFFLVLMFLIVSISKKRGKTRQEQNKFGDDEPVSAASNSPRLLLE